MFIYLVYILLYSVSLVHFISDLIRPTCSFKCPNMGEDKVIPVKVAVRIRPLNDKEAGEGCQAVLEQVEGESQVSQVVL